MSREVYRTFPEQISVREAKVDGQVLVTTMYDARAVRKRELAALYAHRWHVELDIRKAQMCSCVVERTCLSTMKERICRTPGRCSNCSACSRL
jgi:hypothetical protein